MPLIVLPRSVQDSPALFKQDVEHSLDCRNPFHPVEPLIILLSYHLDCQKFMFRCNRS